MRIFATTIALLEWFALALQCWLTVNLSVATGKTALSGLINYFSYFTILCNLLVAIALSFLLVGGRSRLAKFFVRPAVQSGIALYIAIVGIVYSLVLRQVWDPQGLQKLADVLLHDFLPVIYVVFWFLFLSKKPLRSADALWWLIFPALYCGYSLVRGAFTGWYPYAFLDASQSGYGQVAANALILLAAFLALGYVVIAISRWRGRTAN